MSMIDANTGSQIGKTAALQATEGFMEQFASITEDPQAGVMAMDMVLTPMVESAFSMSTPEMEEGVTV